MDFEQIRIFLKVATMKSFSAAAEKMFVSQPGVSVRIKSLEEDLGVTLFDRSRSREMELTEEGRIFMDYAQALLNLEEEARGKLLGQEFEPAGLVRVGASTVPGTYLLPPLLARYKKDNPAVELEITVHDTAAVLEGILVYDFDLGFVGMMKQDERLLYKPLGEDELVFCVPANSVNGKEHSGEISLEVCFPYHLLIREEGSATRTLLDRALKEKGFAVTDFDGITYFNSLEGIKQAVRRGFGAAFVSRRSVEDLVRLGSVEIYRVSGLELKRQLYLVYHRSRVLGSASRRLIKSVETYLDYPVG